MKLLIDTNIFLEVLLGQERSAEAQEMLSAVEQHDFFVSDFALHSIGLLLFRRNRHDVFRQFLDDMIVSAGTSVITLSAKEIETVTAPALDFDLDFDDAYQYAIAERYDLSIVSFDADFDRTQRGRITPDQIATKES